MGKKDSKTSTDSKVFDFVIGWIGKQSTKVQVALAASISLSTIVLIRYFFDSEYFYMFSQITLTIASLILAYKLVKHKNCSGISLRTQELTAVFVTVRLLCSLANDFADLELHLALDSTQLISTGWVIYMMRFKLQSTYAKELDNMPIYYLLVPCFVLSLIAHPGGSDSDMTWLTLFVCVTWAFSTYVEAVSVLPQLRLIQNSKMVEPFTAHYVFALGLSRFFGFGHWLLMVYETEGRSLLMFGSRWYSWLFTYMLSELVQTFILADFCYYYIKSVMRGQRMLLPMPV